MTVSAEKPAVAYSAVGYWAAGSVIAQFASLLVISGVESGSHATDIPIPLLGVATHVQLDQGRAGVRVAVADATQDNDRGITTSATRWN